MGENNIALGEHTDLTIANTVENTVEPLSKNIGRTFGDLWYLAFGGISFTAEKRKIKYAAELEKYKQETEEKIFAIPQNDFKEPDIQVAGQALEKSKYCVENETLRSMFSSLIASSMMKSKEDTIHPAFAEIITQMSTDDAVVFMSFKNGKNKPSQDYKLESNERGFYRVFKHIWTPCCSVEDLYRCETIMDSLARLGLVEISSMQLLNAELYNDLNSPEIYNLVREHIIKFGNFDPKSFDQSYRVTHQKGALSLTQFGERFLSCVT